MVLLKTVVPAAFLGLFSASSALAATVTVDFDSGVLSGGIYEEDGFVFTSNSPGGAGLANNCGSKCLQLNNNEEITVTYVGGAFDILGFDFNAPGNGGDMDIIDDDSDALTITESYNGNTMSPFSFPAAGIDHLNQLQFTFRNAANGSARVDNITFEIAAVPVPASGLILLTALGGFAAVKRRKS